MSRLLRLVFLGALSHATSSGNARKDIYLEDSDFELFLRCKLMFLKWKTWPQIFHIMY